MHIFFFFISLKLKSLLFIKIIIVTGDNIKFKAGNLSLLEILQLYNRYITPHNPKEEKPVVITTKSGKKGLLKSKK